MKFYKHFIITHFIIWQIGKDEFIVYQYINFNYLSGHPPKKNTPQNKHTHTVLFIKLQCSQQARTPQFKVRRIHTGHTGAELVQVPVFKDLTIWEKTDIQMMNCRAGVGPSCERGQVPTEQGMIYAHLSGWNEVLRKTSRKRWLLNWHVTGAWDFKMCLSNYKQFLIPGA